MRKPSVLCGLGFLSIFLLKSAVASAQLGQYTLSGGYSHIYTGSGSNLFYNKDGAYFDADFAWHVPYYHSPIMAGFGIAASGYWDTQYVTVPFNFNGNAQLGTARLDSDLDDFEIEPRVAYELWIPATPLFIKPRIGAGLMFNNYSIDQAFPRITYTYFSTAYHTGAAFDIHPDVQFGAGWGPLAGGFDVSYLAAWGDFGGLGHIAQEIRLGAFIAFRF